MSKSFTVKLLVLLAGIVLVPASTAQAAGVVGVQHAAEAGAMAGGETSAECSAALKDLYRKLVRAKSLLSAESPNKQAAINVLRDATSTVGKARAEQCKFTSAEVAQPPTNREGHPSQPRVAYPELGVDMLGGLLGTLTALVSGLVGGALGLVTNLLATVTSLLGIELPTPPLPSPPLPSLPAK